MNLIVTPRTGIGLSSGVSRSLPAQTVLYARNDDNNRSLTIVNHQSPVFHGPSDYFADKSGTANAAALGGAVLTVANVNTTPVLGAAVSIAPSITKDLGQCSVHIWAALDDACVTCRSPPEWS